MDKFLIDTDILIDLGRKFDSAVVFFDNLPSETIVYLSVVTKMELLAGCRNRIEQRRTESIIESFSVLPITPKESLLACQFYADYHLSHGIGILDCLIGATAIERKIPLATRNRKHFSVLPGITIVTPY